MRPLLRTLASVSPIVATAITFLLVSPTFAQITPGLGDWRTHSTPHFRIHYQKADEELAHRMAGIAEKVHAKLDPKYQTGATETHVILVTSTDLVNAFATPVGLDRVYLFLDHPRPGEFARFDLWAEILFTHEYTHILTLRYYNTPFLYTMRIILGFPPNLIGPIGLQEGYAVYEESQKGKGRLHDPLTHMIVRTAVLEDRFPGAGEAMSGSYRWPHGQTYYLYGAMMAEYLHKTEPEKAGKFWREETPVWFLEMKLSSMRIRSFNLLYRDFRTSKEEEMRKEIESLKAAGLTQYKLLTQDGETKEHLTEGETGLLYFARPGARASGMFRLIPGSEAERIRLSYTSEGMTERNGQILASEDHFFYPGLGIRQELHDARSVLFSRLLPGVSVVDPLFSPDGNTLYYIEKDRFERRLIRASWKNEEIKDPETIFHVPFSGILRFPAVSPDGQQLAFVARKDETGMGVVLVCDARASNCKTVAAGPAAKVRPRFSKDGKQLFFSSDADGIYNIYSVNLASGEILKRTRTLTGFFDPVPTESALYALSYNGKGFDVAEISYEHMLAEKSGLFAAHGDESSFFEAETEAPLPGQPQNWPEDPDYNGALSIRPYFAGLLGSGSLLGLGVAALDPLERHVLAAGIVAGAPDPYAWAFYDYSRFVVGFSGFYSTNYWKRDRAPGCLNPSDPNRFICDDQYSFVESMGGYLRYTFEGRYVSFQVLPGYASTKMRNARRIRTLEMDARDLNLSGPSFAMLLGRTEEFAESVSPERGFRFFALTDYYSKTTSRRELDPQTQRPIDYGTAEGGLALYLPSFFDHHVNYLSGYAFTSYGPDREVEKVRLSRLQRGIAYDRSPTATSAVVWTYEYRLPIAWLSASPGSMPHFILRNIGMSLFYEAGAAFEKIPYQRDYKSSVGVTFQFGITALYLPLAPFRLTFVKGLGREGENQVYLGYETTFGPGMDSGRNIPGNRIVEPWHRPIPRSTEEPGYFRRASAGGILE